MSAADPTTDSRRPRLLALTPAADLYGSDRALLLALPEILNTFHVTLVSAADGPALAAARRCGAKVVLSADWALRRRALTARGFPTSATAVASTLRLLRRMHRLDPFDLVYANTVANGLLPLLSRAVPRPLVVHVREVPRDRSRLSRLLFGTVERVADRVLCNSRFTADLVATITPGVADRLRVVPDGIEPLDPVSHSPDDGTLDVVCVARIHPKKGHSVLVDAARIAATKGRRWRIHLWGDALAEHTHLHHSLLRQIDQARLSGVFRWNGFESDTRRLYDGMDVAVVPSVMPEEFSLVTAEAQVVGLPVVATGPGGPSDILIDGTTGLIVPPNDPAALAAALMRIEDLPDRARWGAAGRERVLARFTTRQYAPAVAAELNAALTS